MRALGLASAAVFREQDGSFRRTASAGWGSGDAAALPPNHPLLARRFSGSPYTLDADRPPGPPHEGRLPDDLARPALAAPVCNPRRCFAVALYSGHEAGTALDRAERELLGTLVRSAEIAYAQVETETLQARVAALERELGRTRARQA